MIEWLTFSMPATLGLGSRVITASVDADVPSMKGTRVGRKVAWLRVSNLIDNWSNRQRTSALKSSHFNENANTECFNSKLLISSAKFFYNSKIAVITECDRDGNINLHWNINRTHDSMLLILSITSSLSVITRIDGLSLVMTTDDLDVTNQQECIR